MGERREWSDLPKELWSPIGKSLDTRIDVLRFRSVCSSWRSSIPPFLPRFPRSLPLNFPHPYRASDSASRPTYLCESTLYRLHRINPPPTLTTSSFSSPSKGWLIKVEESNSGKLRLLDPFSSKRLRYPSPIYQQTLNLLYFRVVELTRAYTLRKQDTTEPMSESEGSIIHGVNRVVMFPNSRWAGVDGCAVFVISLDGKLAFAKYGDEKFSLVDDRSFDDIIVYKGQIYVVDWMGIVSRIEYSSLKLVQFSPPLCGLGSQKYLVESYGALYVVD